MNMCILIYSFGKGLFIYRALFCSMYRFNNDVKALLIETAQNGPARE